MKNKLNLILMIIVIILGLSICEIVFKTYTPKKIIGYITIQDKSDTRDNRYISGEKILYQLNPQDCKEYFDINCQGFRDYKEFSKEKKEGITRIVLLGDSFTENPDLDIEKGYAFNLEQLLKERIDKNIEVYNFGIGGVWNR